MTHKYGFEGELKLPKPKTSRKAAAGASAVPAVEQAVAAGRALGFVDRTSQPRAKPGPKRKEPQDKVTIPGPKRVIDHFRAHCKAHDLTLWEGLEDLLKDHPAR